MQYSGVYISISLYLYSLLSLFLLLFSLLTSHFSLSLSRFSLSSTPVAAGAAQLFAVLSVAVPWWKAETWIISSETAQALVFAASIPCTSSPAAYHHCTITVTIPPHPPSGGPHLCV